MRLLVAMTAALAALEGKRSCAWFRFLQKKERR
jgi:hypothetical protein